MVSATSMPQAISTKPTRSQLLIGRGSAGLAPGTAGALLLVHPVLSVVLGMLVLGETLTAWQVAGCALVVATVAALVGPAGTAGRLRRVVDRHERAWATLTPRA